MKNTVKQLRAALEGVADETSVVVRDTRSGVTEEASFGSSEWNECDEESGAIDGMTIGALVFKIYLG